MTGSVPTGWTTVSLGDLCQDRVAQGPPTDQPVPYIDISSIDRFAKQIGDTKFVTEADAPTRARQWVETGDVVVSLTRPNLNAVARVGRELNGAVASTGFDVLRPVGVVPSWIFYRVRTTEFVADLCEELQGVVYPAIRPHDVRRHKLPLPPLPEQHRIVAALESYFTRLDDAVATLERVQRNLKRYRASVLKAAVEGRLVPTEAELARAEGRAYEPASVLLERILVERRRRWEEAELAKMEAKGKVPKDDRWKANYQDPEPINTSHLPALPEGWLWTSVDAVGDVLLGRQRAPQFLTGRHARPYLRVANIKDDRVDLSDLEEMDFHAEHFEKYRLEPGDVLVSEGQSPELLGQSAVYGGGIEGLCFQKTLHRFRPVAPHGPSSAFAQLVFRSHVKSGVFKKLGSITTNIGHLTLIKFKGAPFPLPPAREQERITRETQRILSITDDMESSNGAHIVRCARLRQSILRWAFEGRLVDQDPNDEPAAVLLERIRAQRESSVGDRTSTRRSPSAGKRRTDGRRSPA